MTKSLLIFFLCFLTIYKWKAQNYFKAHASLGLAGTQLEGDGYGGYKKLGLNAAVGIHRNFHKNLAWYADLQFIQMGAQQLPNVVLNLYDYYHVNVNYIGVPLYLRVKQERYYLDAGLELNTTILRKKERANINNNYQNIDEINPFDRFAMNYRYGLGYVINQKWEATISGSFSIIPARTTSDIGAPFFTASAYSRIAGPGQYHNTIRVHLTYNFIKND
jgi:hypothetical protein